MTDLTKPNNLRELVRVILDRNVLDRKVWKVDAKIAGFSPDGNWLITYAGSDISDLPIAITSVDGTKTHRIAKGIDGVLWSR